MKDFKLIRFPKKLFISKIKKHATWLNILHYFNFVNGIMQKALKRFLSPIMVHIDYLGGNGF